MVCRELADDKEGSHRKCDCRGKQKAKAAAGNRPTHGCTESGRTGQQEPREMAREPGRRATCTATSASGSSKSTGYELIDLTEEANDAREEARAGRPPAALLSINHHAASMLTFDDMRNEGGMDLDTDEYEHKLFGDRWMDAAIDNELRDPLEQLGQPEADNRK